MDFLLLVLITIMVIAKPDKTDMFIDTIYSFNPPPPPKKNPVFEPPLKKNMDQRTCEWSKERIKEEN